MATPSSPSQRRPSTIAARHPNDRPTTTPPRHRGTEPSPPACHQNQPLPMWIGLSPDRRQGLTPGCRLAGLRSAACTPRHGGRRAGRARRADSPAAEENGSLPGVIRPRPSPPGPALQRGGAARGSQGRLPDPAVVPAPPAAPVRVKLRHQEVGTAGAPRSVPSGAAAAEISGTSVADQAVLPSGLRG